MAYNSTNEKSVISNFCSFFNFSRTNIQVHAMIICWKRFQMEIPHTIEFQLKGKSRFQVTVNTIFKKLIKNSLVITQEYNSIRKQKICIVCINSRSCSNGTYNTYFIFKIQYLLNLLLCK